MEIKGKIINFLGDSITEGHGTTSPDKVYHQLIAQKYGMKAAYNYGLGGTRIARQTKPTHPGTKYDLTFEMRAETMDREVDAVVVFGGTNDFGHGDALFGSLDSTDIYTFCGAVNSLINKLKKDFPEVKIIFMTPLHRTEENVPFAPEGKLLKDYVYAVKEICKRWEIPVIDLFEINPLDAADENLVPDGLHPSDSGHAIMAEVIGKELEKI